MDRLGPFEPCPAIAVAVSGGADSMALARLARDWVRHRDGSVLALVVDHGLRSASADEARVTIERLTSMGIPARVLLLSDLTHGPALAERARLLRYDILTTACRDASILHLLLGHHAADQAETLAMRVLRGSQTHGLAGMSGLRETAGLRLLRPLLDVEPAHLRAYLSETGIAWVEDPSNQDTRALRPRLRQRLAGGSRNNDGLPAAMASVAALRVREEIAIAKELARRAVIRSEGFAVLSPGRIGATALGNLIRTIGGHPYTASLGQISALAAQPGPATVAGVRILPAGRFGDGWLIVREEAAIMAPVAARRDTMWDDRFRLRLDVEPAGTATIGKLGEDAAGFRGLSDLPSAILRTLPALRFSSVLAAVPHLGFTEPAGGTRVTVLFTPLEPAAGGCFIPARQPS
jgi:tRNA(Ile)-lysidine synthase